MLYPGLVLTEANGEPTSAAEAVLRDAGLLPLAEECADAHPEKWVPVFGKSCSRHGADERKKKSSRSDARVLSCSARLGCAARRQWEAEKATMMPMNIYARIFS